MISEKISTVVEQSNDELIQLRRTLHREPELSFEEVAWVYLQENMK